MKYVSTHQQCKLIIRSTLHFLTVNWCMHPPTQPLCTPNHTHPVQRVVGKQSTALQSRMWINVCCIWAVSHVKQTCYKMCFQSWKLNTTELNSTEDISSNKHTFIDHNASILWYIFSLNSNLCLKYWFNNDMIWTV